MSFIEFLTSICFSKYSFAIFALWAVFISTQFQKLFEKLKFYKERDPQIKEEHKPFERNDFERWDRIEMILVAIFILPFRIIILLFAIGTLTLAANVLFRGLNAKTCQLEFASWKSWYFRFHARVITSNLIAFACGFYDIKRKKLSYDDFPEIKKQFKNNLVQNNPKLKESERFKKMRWSPIIVSNHVSWFDIMIHTNLNSGSFLSKMDIINYPLWGVSAMGLQSIFLERENKQERSSSIDAIKQRCDFILDGKNIPPIVIFPEGTTTNNQYIISFKKGAFQNLSPVKPYVFKYGTRKFTPCLDSLGMGAASLFMLCQWKNELNVYEFDDFYPEVKQQEGVQQDEEKVWEAYSSIIKAYMLKCSGLKDSNTGYRQMREYYDVVLKERKNEFRDQKKKE